MPFIIWGTRGITSTTDSGSFHCPRCGPAAYEHKRVRSFFTLYWIPLIPLSTLGEYVECGQCADTFDTAVLDYDPAEQHARFLSKLDRAAHRLMALMVLADGEIEDEEIEAMVHVSSSLPGQSLTEEQARAEVEAASQESKDLVGYVIDVRDELNEQGKNMLLQVALAIATSDGDFADEEKMLLLQIGEALGLDGNGVLAAIGVSGEA